jgi:hypothetical protein
MLAKKPRHQKIISTGNGTSSSIGFAVKLRSPRWELSMIRQSTMLTINLSEKLVRILTNFKLEENLVKISPSQKFKSLRQSPSGKK